MRKLVLMHKPLAGLLAWKINNLTFNIAYVHVYIAKGDIYVSKQNVLQISFIT